MARNPKKIVALDIGSSVVKAVQLKRSGRVYELDKFGIADIYPGVDKKSTSLNRREARIDAVKQALSSGGISAKFAVSAVSGESIIVRYIQLPDMGEDEVANAIQWEAEEYIPFPLDEVSLDSMVLGRSNLGGQNKLDVLLVAAKRELVAEHVDIIKAAELTPDVVDVNSFAFLNNFEVNYLPSASEVICLLDIGAENCSINIYVGGVSRFSRDIAIAGDAMTSQIQQRLGCSFQRAEELKIKEGISSGKVEESDEDSIVTGSSLLETIRGTVEKITGESLGEESPELVAAQVIKSTLGTLTNEIKRSIQFFENQPNGKPVQRVAAGGGTSRLKGLEQFLSRELHLPVETIDPLRNISFNGSESDQKRLEAHRQQLGVGVGLALRAFEG